MNDTDCPRGTPEGPAIAVVTAVGPAVGPAIVMLANIVTAGTVTEGDVGTGAGATTPDLPHAKVRVGESWSQP
jgi:hypothetical protein